MSGPKLLRSKLLRSLIIPLALLVLAGGVYLYLRHRQGAKEEPVADNRIALSRHEKEAILRMELESAAGRVVLVKKDGEWQVAEPYPVALNQARADDIAYSFSRLFAERVVEENPEDLGLYGLEKPRATARAVLADQSELRFYLGDKTSVGDSYYLQVAGSPAVYTVWRTHGVNFQAGLADLRERSLPRLKPEGVKYFRRQWPGAPVIEIRKTPELAEGEEETEFRLGLWRMDLPYARPQWVEGNEFAKVIEGLSMLWIDEFVDDHPADLGRYGLAKPRGELLVQGEENTLHLLFGVEKDGLVYFKTPDADNVYAMKKSRLSVMELKPFNLVEKFILLAFIDRVERVLVEAGEEKYALTIEREEKPRAKKGKGEEEEIAAVYRINGRETGEEAFKKLYQEIIGLRFDAENDRKQVAGAPVVQISFTFGTSDRRMMSYGFLPYDKDFYVVTRDEGTADFLIARNRVEKMLAAVRAQAGVD